jgi:chorismate mutase
VTIPAELDALRRAIDDIDVKILDLVSERVKVVLAVGDYKRARAMSAYDPERERQMLERLCARAQSPLDPETVRRIFERLIDESRRIEQGHMHGKSQGK